MMRRRDRQNEMVVALIVLFTMALAMIFGILLSLGDNDAEESEPATSTSLSTETEERNIAVPPSPLPATDTLQPSLTPTASPSVSHTATPTATETDTPTHTPTVTNTDTATATPTVTDTDTPMHTVTASATNTATPTTSPSATHTLTPSTTPSATPRPTLTVIPLVIRDTPTPRCIPPDDWQVYVVQEGDTFFSIALRYNRTVNSLADQACIDNPRRIFVGQAIRVPPGGAIQVSNDAAVSACNSEQAILTAPSAGASLEGFVTLRGVATGDDFRRYLLDWRPDEPTIDYTSFEQVFNAQDEVGDLGRFNTDAFEPGLYWFRLRVLDSGDFIIGQCEIRVRFR